LVGVACAHAAVDLFSFVIIPLLTVLEGRLSLSPTQGAFLVAIGSVASGVVQPLTAYWGDRHDTRWIGVAGQATTLRSPIGGTAGCRPCATSASRPVPNRPGGPGIAPAWHGGG
jgi:MFS family permease